MEDKVYFATETRKGISETLKCIRKAKKISLTSIEGRNSIMLFEKKPATTRVSTVERYISALNVEIVMKIMNVGEYNCNSFAEGLRYAMLIKGVSYKQISKSTGFKPTQPAKHIGGYVGMHVYQLEAYCKALRVKISFRNKLK